MNSLIYSIKLQPTQQPTDKPIATVVEEIVVDIPSPPLLTDDTAKTKQNVPVLIPVLGNDIEIPSSKFYS